MYPVSTYTRCENEQFSVPILRLNGTSCSDCVGTTCGKCIDYINGNIGYNCNGCVVVMGNRGYCSATSTTSSCSRCTPVIATANCGNSNNAYLYLNLH